MIATAISKAVIVTAITYAGSQRYKRARKVVRIMRKVNLSFLDITGSFFLTAFITRTVK